MIKKGFEATAYRDTNNLIDEGEGILETCSLENISQHGGPEARRNAIELWLAKAEAQTRPLLVEPERAALFSVARFTEQIEALNPQPPSTTQMRHAFCEVVEEKLRMLNEMIGRSN